MKNAHDAVIVTMGRSPIGDLGGGLKTLLAHQLAAQIIKGVLAKVPEVDPGTLAGYKVPKRVFVTTEVPKNPSGKILKKNLRKQYEGKGGAK